MFYGWTILAVAALAMFGTGPGQSHLIGLFFDPMQAELGLSRTQISTAYGSATLIAALLLPRMGRLIDKFGPARMIWLIIPGVGLAAIVTSLATGWIFLAIAFGALRFLGQGSLMMNCANITSQWFDRKRGFALGIMALGFPISIAIHPPLTQWLIAELGWRDAWIALGLITILALLPPALLFLHSRPEDVGLKPDGDKILAAGEASKSLTGFTKHEALKMRAFYILVAGMFCMSLLMTALHVEFTGILKSHGLEPGTAASMFTVTGITAALMMPVIGRLLDTVPTKWMFFLGLLVQSASLISVSLATNTASAVIFGVIFGVNNAITMTYVGYLWPRYFGRRHLGEIQGTGQMILVVGASIGPLPLAWAIDNWGNYDDMLRLLALAPLAMATIVAFLLPAPNPPSSD
jgi:MFS family permease